MFEIIYWVKFDSTKSLKEIMVKLIKKLALK